MRNDVSLGKESRNPNDAITPQLEAWTGQFGDDYVDRNVYADGQTAHGTAAFRRMVGGLTIESVLEVGSNIGLKLLYINEVFSGKLKLYAIEPNRKAFKALVTQSRLKLEKAWNCDGFVLPLGDSSIDLVFTAGVLIHVAPEDLPRITDEIVRVSRRYILCIEYFSHAPVEVPYRGRDGLLFKRDFGAFYLDRFHFLKTVNYGFLWQREFPNFGNVNWWLFEKKC